MLAAAQDAHERSEEIKRKYRKARALSVDAAVVKRRRSNVLHNKHSKRFAYSVVALAIIASITATVDREQFKSVSTLAQGAAADISAKAHSLYFSLSKWGAVDGPLAKAPNQPALPAEVAPVASVVGASIGESPVEAPQQAEVKDLVVDTATIVDVPFLKSVSDLGPKGKQAVAGVAKTLGSPRLVEVIGMADRSEDKALATVRSVSVVDALVRAGINPTIIKFSGVSFNASEVGSEVTGARITAFAESSEGKITAAVIAPSVITPGAALGEIDAPTRRPAFPLFPLPMGQAGSKAPVATIQPLEKAKATVQAPEPVAANAEAVDDSLAAAIGAAARRIAGGNTSQKPKATSVGVDVTLRAQPSKDSKGVDAEAVSSQPRETATSGTPGAIYSVVQVLEQGLLVREGNKVQLVKPGKTLPDGTVLATTDVAAGTFQTK